jgi:steroid delta-isomerase-like uncharacterized protein
MSKEENKANSQRMVEEVANGGNYSIIGELISPDYVVHLPDGEDYRGIDGAKRYFTEMRTAAPDMHTTIEDMVAEGDIVAARFTSSGTHKGNFMGISPTGKKFTLQGANIVRYKNDKQAEVWLFYNILNILQQLGIAPPMAQAVR